MVQERFLAMFYTSWLLSLKFEVFDCHHNSASKTKFKQKNQHFLKIRLPLHLPLQFRSRLK